MANTVVLCPGCSHEMVESVNGAYSMFKCPECGNLVFSGATVGDVIEAIYAFEPIAVLEWYDGFNEHETQCESGDGDLK